jgi:hypothetical protein
VGQSDEQSRARTSEDRLTAFSRGRRALAGSMAALGAGLATSVIVPTDTRLRLRLCLADTAIG